MKKQQIPFDFFKWGQEGISVTYFSEQVIALHKHPNDKNKLYGMFDIGDLFVCDSNSSALIMYDEKKPREIWINEYPYEHPGFYTSEADAIEDTREYFIKRRKFIEVL